MEKGNDGRVEEWNRGMVEEGNDGEWIGQMTTPSYSLYVYICGKPGMWESMERAR